MRILLLAAALALSACGQRSPETQVMNGCGNTVRHEVAWSNEARPDIILASSEGPSCAQAVVTLVIRNADGDPLWAFASTYYDLTMGGVPPEGAEAISDERMEEFLTGWANVTEQTSNELPEWREGFDSLSASAQTFSYDTPFDRETYEMLRGRNLRMLCYAAAVEGSQCLIIDPASQAPIMIVAFGP
jgi:hypothetical protein